MAGYAGSVGLTGYVAPKDTADTYAIQDERFNRGGYRTVADITERDAITADRRKEGMLVKVLDDGKVYTLSGGINNSNWIIADLSGFPNWRWDTEYLQAQTTAQQMPENFGVFLVGAFTKSSGDGVADYYLPKIDYDNFNLYSNIILVKHSYDSPEGSYENIRILPEAVTGDADNLYDAKGNPLSEVILKPGETAIFQCTHDDPMDWHFYGKLGEAGSSGGNSQNWEDIPTNSSIRDEGYYFSYGNDREITIQNDGSNRVINIKVVTGNCILKNDEGIFDGVTQDLQLSTGSAIKIACKEDDTYWILNEY